MSTIAEFRVSATETTLGPTFERAPGVRFELESSVSRTRPCLWVVGASPDEIGAAFEADPSIEAHELLVNAPDRLLYDVSFAGDIPCLSADVIEESDGCSLLALWGCDGWWQARVRVQNREDLWRIHERLVRSGRSVDLRRVTDVSATGETEPRLTPEQQEALEAALERGYFEIPRGISMEELAAELGISHQALSERLRRAYETLVDQELRPGGPEREESTNANYGNE